MNDVLKKTVAGKSSKILEQILFSRLSLEVGLLVAIINSCLLTADHMILVLIRDYPGMSQRENNSIRKLRYANHVLWLKNRYRYTLTMNLEYDTKKKRERDIEKDRN